MCIRDSSLAARGVKTNKYMAPKLFEKVRASLSGAKSRFRIAKYDVTSLLHKKPKFDDNNIRDDVPEQENTGDRYNDVGIGTTDPGKGRRRATERPKLEGAVEDIVRSEGSFSRAKAQLDKNQPGLAFDLLLSGKTKEGLKLTAQQRESLQTAMNTHAVTLAQAGFDIPHKVTEHLDPGVKKRLEAFIEKRDELPESALGAQLRQLGHEATSATVDALPALLGEVGQEGALSQISTQDKQFTGTAGQIDRLEHTPFFDPVNPHGDAPSGANAFVDDKGKFGDFDVPKSSDAFNFAPLASGGNTNVALKDDIGSISPFGGGVSNVALGGGAGNVNKELLKSSAERVSENIDSLHNSKRDLTAVDLSAFDEGNKAFKSGDREGLISSIAELQSQEGKLKDRWDLVSQTHANLKSAGNHDSAFAKSKGGGLGSLFNRSGADRLVNQTEKLSDVRGDLMKANNRAFARRKMLEFRLQRLDAQVPPETWAPKSITRFDDDVGDSLTGVFDKAAGW